MSAWLVLGTATLYLAGLFALAKWGETRAARSAPHGQLRAVLHGLALGVYCSTWTVFGAIGSAVREGYGYLPIYLGPLFVALVTPFVWERLVRLKQRHRLASVADFLGARFGRGSALPALVALVSLVAVVPYVALQLTALGGSLQVLGIERPQVWVLIFAVLMVLFTLRFGVLDARALVERPGLVLVLGIESAVKLLILLGIALWASSHAGGTPGDWHAALLARGSPDLLSLAGQTLLAAGASLLLPRMFQIGVVECAALDELKLARRVFAGYLLLVSAAVLPIAALAGATASTGSDHLLISLPLARAQPALAVLAFLAGLSAASAMMIAAWLALSTMLSNDLLVPALLRLRNVASAGLVLKVRRAAVPLTASISAVWYVSTASGTLVQMGLLAFAGVAQFAPAVLAGLYTVRASAVAAFSALLVGAAAWTTMLVLPYLHGASLSSGELTRRALLALALNALTLTLISLLKPATLRQALRAADFLSSAAAEPAALSTLTAVRADDLYALLENLLGKQHFAQALSAHYGAALPKPTTLASQTLLAAAVQAITEVFGSASARELIVRGLSGKSLNMHEVLSALDQSSSRYRINAQLLSTTFEHMHQAVSVVDSELRLAAWNRRYEALFAWPPGLLEPGQPIADLIAHGARMSQLDDSQVAARIARRLAQLRAATAYRSVRTLPDGRTLDVRGEPLPEGGFVTTFFDISESVRSARALEEANVLLEERVAARTLELQRLGELKNQFLAAASHDLLQPLSAARLYLAAAQSVAGAEHTLLERADRALGASEELLSGLTDLARLETGQLQPELRAIDLAALLGALAAQSQVLAEQRGIRLQLHPCTAWIVSDPRLLQRIVQNYLSNALRYTARGSVLIGARRCGPDAVRIVVYDTGPGIAEELLPRLFGELNASASVSPWGERGLGLGLSGSKRLADALGHPVAVRSQPGRGSAFSVTVSRAPTPEPVAPATEVPRTRLSTLRVLCVDDHPDVLSALLALLSRWGVQVLTVASAEAALLEIARAPFDLALVDFALGPGHPNGLQLIAELRTHAPDLRAALVTAETDPQLPTQCAAANVALLRKPVRPAALRALLESLASG